MAREPVNEVMYFAQDDVMSTPGDRRSNDVKNAIKLGVLEAEMKNVVESVHAITEDIKEVTSDIAEIKNSILKLVFESERRSETTGRIEMEQAMIKSDIGILGKGLTAHIEAEEKMFAEHVKTTKPIDDPLEATKKKVVTILQISIGIVAILALLVFAERNILSHEAFQTVKTIEGVTH